MYILRTFPGPSPMEAACENAHRSYFVLQSDYRIYNCPLKAALPMHGSTAILGLTNYRQQLHYVFFIVLESAFVIAVPATMHTAASITALIVISTLKIARRFLPNP